MPFDGTLYEDDEILRVLRAAQEHIRDPENWCQHDRIGPRGKVCAAGAIHIATGTLYENDVWTVDGAEAGKYLDAAARKFGFDFAFDLNDDEDTDHPMVMAMFDRAQELCLADMMEAAVA